MEEYTFITAMGIGQRCDHNMAHVDTNVNYYAVIFVWKRGCMECGENSALRFFGLSFVCARETSLGTGATSLQVGFVEYVSVELIVYGSWRIVECGALTGSGGSGLERDLWREYELLMSTFNEEMRGDSSGDARDSDGVERMRTDSYGCGCVLGFWLLVEDGYGGYGDEWLMVEWRIVIGEGIVIGNLGGCVLLKVCTIEIYTMLSTETMLRATGVQIPEDDLDNLHSLREVDGILVFVDPQDLLGFLEYTNLTTGLCDSESRTIGFLEGTSLVVVILVKGHAFPTIVKVRPVEKEQEPETITKVVEIASSKSTPFVPPPETPPLSTPKSKIYGDVSDHFIYLIDIVDSLCDKFPIKNNYLSDNPTPSSDFVVESLSPLPIPYEDNDSLVEETDILLSHLDDSPPEYETFSFDIEEKSSGSTTTHSNYSLPDYEAFYFDDKYIKEKSRRSTTTHSDYSLLEYDLFIFDLSIDPLPSADRSDLYHEEFADRLAHIISPPEYDHFYFDLEIIP
ncbi:hypothetical protein Tco_1082319 [Tanacetum coccineum]|uniref:Uncharacterized protein n=1 Tax=Tanacetum coccineum TaxID=301880 RepID=A0ABQ5I047_9ASTR